MGYASAPIFVSPFPPPHPPRTPTDRDARRLEANLDSTALHPQYIHTWRPSLRVSLPLPTQTLLVQIFDGREAYKSENSPNTSATPLPPGSQASRFFGSPTTYINHTLHRSVLNDFLFQTALTPLLKEMPQKEPRQGRRGSIHPR